MPKSVTLKILGSKLIKLNCIITKIDLDTTKKRERELDGAYGFPLVKSEIYTKFALKWCTRWKVLNFMFEISIWSSFWYYIWNLYKIVAAGTTG